jgi:hypothetical protein
MLYVRENRVAQHTDNHVYHSAVHGSFGITIPIDPSMMSAAPVLTRQQRATQCRMYFMVVFYRTVVVMAFVPK